MYRKQICFDSLIIPGTNGDIKCIDTDSEMLHTITTYRLVTNFKAFINTTTTTSFSFTCLLEQMYTALAAYYIIVPIAKRLLPAGFEKLNDLSKHCECRIFTFYLKEL